MIKDSLFQTLDIKTSLKNVEYSKALNFMEKKVENILTNKDNEMLWFLNHNHIYTCGTSWNKNEILNKTEIPIIKTNRGGKITYHGPGQRIIYYMINLNNRKKDIRHFINSLEKIAIETLKEFDVIAVSNKDKIGIWVTKINNNNLKQEKKIGSIGIRLKKWVTYHGLSLNISTDLKYFNNINPCGIKDCQVTSLKDLGVNIPLRDFDKILIEKSKKYFLL